eukprot:symbB.v1.2.035281.t1/scaffold4712.1/size36010/3
MLCPPHHFCPEESSEPQLCPGGYRCQGEELHTLLSTAKGWPLWKQLTATAERFMLVAGCWHTMVMVKNQLWTWGQNNHGQLGLGHTNRQLQPVQAAIAAGGYHSLALSNTGELWTWGHNGDGQLGIGHTNNQLQPVKVPIDKSFVAIAAGDWHSLALSVTGESWTWGYNGHGELGIGHTNNQLQPVKVAIDKSFVATAAGHDHSLALSDTGELWTWGYNNHGQLGLGHTNNQLQPVKVAIDKSFVAIAAGKLHSLALLDTGELWTWGHNGDGQLGIGHTNNQLQPVKVNLAFDIPKSAYFSCSDSAGFAFSACASSGGSAIPYFSHFLKTRSGVGCSVGAKEAQECDPGTYCPAGKSYAITCPGGHFCNEGATRPEPCAAGWVCPPGTSNQTTRDSSQMGVEANEEGLPSSCLDELQDVKAKLEQTSQAKAVLKEASAEAAAVLWLANDQDMDS